MRPLEGGREAALLTVGNRPGAGVGLKIGGMEEPQRGKPGQGLDVLVTGDAACEEFCGGGDEEGTSG
jgi:hypothetical protein